ncbi:MAG: DUF1538 domain-containing protein [Lachnospiraceae bacterium]|nr:DUF1538 domain-containing protein [Lachnospiraceae bacterium]
MKEKMAESVASVLPITLIVFILCMLFVPVDSGLMLSFLLGAVMIIVGMGLFTIGSDLSMTQIGNHIGAKMTKTRKLWLILILSFILGVAITIAEPDLTVLATNTPAIDTGVLIIVVSVGVGFFLMLSMLRILLGIPLKWLLIVFYAAVFLLAAFSEKDFLSVAFDSGGVTTGPMTVPFIMALGVGVASIRSDENAKTDGFGLVALCSIGPILAVLILGFIYQDGGDAAATILVNKYESTVEMGMSYLHAFPEYMKEVVMALSPIFAFFLLFQVVTLRLKKRSFLKIVIGIVYTYIGLVLFLTGVNVGFSSLGYVLGEAMVLNGMKWLLVPLAVLMGWFIINAEPAVHVLNKQVMELSAGAISEKAMGRTLSIAVASAMGLAMIRLLTGVSILWFMVPGYLIALALAFVVPRTFTAIAFDAGGVASGPLTATFMLPFAMGACTAIGGNVMTDAFGLVAMVAMMPLITVQIMGAISTVKSRKGTPVIVTGQFGDEEVIELWEVQ